MAPPEGLCAARVAWDTLPQVATVVVVGGGVLGTMHAYAAQERGHDVVQLEADLEARKASVRNFGLVWVSGRAPGPELHLALRARELWELIGQRAPDVGFRPDGSITVAQHPGELAVLEAVAAAPEAKARRFHMLEPAEVPKVNPAIRGAVLGALHCRRDTIVEPRRVLPAFRAAMAERGGYTFVAGRVATEAAPGRVRDHTGQEWRGDLAILCPGAAHAGVAAPWLAAAPLRRCRLQMMQTAPLDERLTTSIADGDSLRYYPAFAVPEAAALPAQAAVGAAWHAQLLIARARRRRAHDRRHPRVRGAVRLRRRRRAVRAPGRPRRVDPGPSPAPGAAPVGRRLLPGDGCLRVRPGDAGAGTRDRDRTRRTGHDAVTRDRGRDVRRDGLVIRLAVLDMAGTTVSDGGVVERSFVEALGDMGFDPDGAELQAHLDYVRSTMGQSKITVFRSVFDGDEERAQEANRRFETAFDRAVSRGEIEPLPGSEVTLEALRARGVRICLTTGFSSSTREQLMDALGWGDLVDLALSPGDGVRGRPFPDLILTALMRLDIDAVQEVAVAGDTTSDLVAGTAAGAAIVAGVLTGAHDRAQLGSVPHTHILDSIADLPAVAFPT